MKLQAFVFKNPKLKRFTKYYTISSLLHIKANYQLPRTLAVLALGQAFASCRYQVEILQNPCARHETANYQPFYSEAQPKLCPSYHPFV